MEVLKESLSPFLMDTEIRWHPPQGYSVVDSTPKSLGTLYCHQTHLAFAFLRRTPPDAILDSSCNNGTSYAPATIRGSLHGGAEVRVPIEEAILPPLSPPQVEELASILTQVGQWGKLEELEVARLLSVSRKNSTEDEAEDPGEEGKRGGAGGGPPKAKRPRLMNGDVSGSGSIVATTTSTGNGRSSSSAALSSAAVVPMTTTASSSSGEIQRELLQLSLESGVPCPFTYLRGTTCPVDGREMLQALPYKKRPAAIPTAGKNGVFVHHQTRKRRRRHNNNNGGSNNASNTAPLQGHAPNNQDGISRATALAKSTISVVGSSIMNFVNMFHSDSAASSMLEAELEEDGNTLEDEVALRNRKGNQLFWDENRAEIRYPSMYYHSTTTSTTCSSNNHTHQNGTTTTSTSSVPSSSPSTNHSSHMTSRPHPHHATTNGYSHHHHQDTKMAAVQTAAVTSSHCHAPSQLAVQNATPTSTRRHSPSQPADQRYVVDTSSSSDDEEESFGISDSESDSSVELDWEALPKTREYLPLMQMQLFSGAWPIGHEFSYAIRVPMGEIGKLPLLSQQQQPQQVARPAAGVKKTVVVQNGGGCVVVPGAGGVAQQEEGEESAHFWTTALAVACFRECFPQFEEEWELIVRKGEDWLENNLSQCSLSKGQIQTTAKELLFRKY